MRAAPLSDPAASRAPSGLKASAVIFSSGQSSTSRIRPDSASRIRTLPSASPEAKRRPSGA